MQMSGAPARMARTTASANFVRFSNEPPNSSVRWLMSGEQSEPTKRSPCTSMASAPERTARSASAVMLARMASRRSASTSFT